jgi:SAM-dependent methyltransferase
MTMVKNWCRAYNPAMNLHIPVPPDHELRRIGPIFDRDTYLKTGIRSRDHLLRYANLTQGQSVIDIGCGFGRVAVHLQPIVSRYLGLDVVKSEIEWCRENIAHDAFSFDHLDVRNDRYNPQGLIEAEAVSFPVPEGTRFDLAFLFSVFTHMLPGAVASYLREIKRHIEPGGTLFVSFFLMNGEARRLTEAGRSQFRFLKRDGFYVANPELPEAAVAYDEDVVWRLMLEAGFTREKVIYGNWPGRRTGADNGQDFVVCRNANP